MTLSADRRSGPGALLIGPAWVIAAHRFAEVSIGIAVGLIVTALWPEKKSGHVTLPRQENVMMQSSDKS